MVRRKIRQRAVDQVGHQRWVVVNQTVHVGDLLLRMHVGGERARSAVYLIVLATTALLVFLRSLVHNSKVSLFGIIICRL